MKKIGLFLLLGVSLSWLVSACQGRQQEVRKEVPLDSIVLSDPCILADRKTAMYYMTGTGGMLWKSKDLKLWEGPFHVAKTYPVFRETQRLNRRSRCVILKQVFR